MKRLQAYFLLFVVFAVVSTLVWKFTPNSLHAFEKKEAIVDKVRLVIEHESGFEKHYTQIKYRSGMTVLQMMQQMQKHPQTTPFKVRGSGTLTFLYELDSIANQGAAKNWIYYVNAKRATEGIGTKTLRARDIVRWKFEAYE
ncbi:MAG: DUF4430 domain-containing protein [Planctomycetaceae bacterium]|jgi:hypothetical protein|nr:DUF4430 domain-containing protein [Planctomycetaceae bacterium]